MRACLDGTCATAFLLRELVNRGKTHVRTASGCCHDHGGLFRPVYTRPQVRRWGIWFDEWSDEYNFGGDKDALDWIIKKLGGKDKVVVHEGVWRDFKNF